MIGRSEKDGACNERGFCNSTPYSTFERNKDETTFKRRPPSSEQSNQLCPSPSSNPVKREKENKV
jgi:hypothetical protein